MADINRFSIVYGNIRAFVVIIGILDIYGIILLIYIYDVVTIDTACLQCLIWQDTDSGIIESLM